MAAPKRTRMSADARRELILDAARRVFLEAGYAGARTRRIAEEAGITEAFLYRFYPSKRDIYLAAVEEPLEQFVAQLVETAEALEASGLDGPEQLEQLNRTIFEFMAESGPLLAVVLVSDLSAGSAFYNGQLRPALSAPLEDIVSRLTGWTSGGHGGLVFTAIFGVHMGLAIDAMLRDVPVDRAQMAHELTGIFSAGMSEAAQTAPARFQPSR